MILSQENNSLRQRIATHLIVAKKSQASNKKTIVAEVTRCIVPNDGKPKLFLWGNTIKLANLLWIPFRSVHRFCSSRPSFSTSVPRLLSEYRNTTFTLQDGLCEWKGKGGLLFLHQQETLLGMLQLKRMSSFWELSSFVIQPHYQGKGYGKHMLQTAIDGVDLPVCLRVKQDNPAQQLYKSVGFQMEDVSNGRYIMKYLNWNLGKNRWIC